MSLLEPPKPARPSRPAPRAGTATPAADDFTRLCDRVRHLCGVDLAQYKRTQMERRVRTWATDRGTPDLDDYAQRLRREPAELEAFLDRVTINVSQLWRHPEQWRHVAELILPAVAERRHGRVRAWSAGSSYGAEAYTLAAVAAETRHQIEILGTDLDPRMVARAREGTLTAADAVLAPPAAMKRHFESQPDGGWRAGAALRRVVRFEQGDLLRMPVREGRFDLVMCRNTVIYFNEPVRDALHERLARSLAPGGWLVVGPSERVGTPAAFGLEPVVPFVYKRI